MTLKVLVVEDEPMIALHMEDMVIDLGHRVAATAMRLTEALEAAERCDLDFAILDVNLAGATSFPVADVLARRSVPYVFATGYGLAGIIAPYNAQPIMHKPIRVADLSRHMAAAEH